MAIARPSSKTKSLSTQTESKPFLSTSKLLDSFLYKSEIQSSSLTEDDIYYVLDQYNTLYYHQPNISGILRKYCLGQYELYTRQKIERTTEETKAEVYQLLIQNDGEVIVKDSKETLSVLKSDTFHDLLLLTTQFSSIYFSQSLHFRKKCIFKPIHPYPEDHFISFILGGQPHSVKTWEILYQQIPVINSEFKQEKTISRTARNLKHNELKHEESLFTDELIQLFKTGTIRIFLFGHGNAGCDALYDDYDHPWEIAKIMFLLNCLKLPRQAEIHIDTFSCCVGESRPKKPSFIRQLSQELKRHDYSNASITGNRLIIYFRYNLTVLIQNSRFVCTAGKTRRRFTSMIDIRNSEVYQVIQESIIQERKETFLKNALKALKKTTDHICEDAEKSYNFNHAYDLLEQALNKHRELILLTKKIKALYLKTYDYATENPPEISKSTRLAFLRKAYSIYLHSTDPQFIYQWTHDHFVSLKKLDAIADKIIDEITPDKFPYFAPKIPELRHQIRADYQSVEKTFHFEEQFHRTEQWYAQFMHFNQLMQTKTFLVNTTWKLSFWDRSQVTVESKEGKKETKECRVPKQVRSIWSVIEKAEQQQVPYDQAKKHIQDLANKAKQQSSPQNREAYSSIVKLCQ